jgi:hypothetical protein
MVEMTNFYGIVIRADALARNSISVEEFCKKTEASLLSKDENLVSFGPCFGEEAGNKIASRIDALGFEYVSDYFIFNFDMPDWIKLSAAINILK